jgi:hypothetical protein
MSNDKIDPRDREAHEELKAFWRDHLQFGGPRKQIQGDALARVRALIDGLHDEALKRSTLGRFRQNGADLPEPVAGRARFQLPLHDGGSGGYNGYTVGETWNGWACPRLPRSAVDAMVAEFAADAVNPDEIGFEFRGDVLWQRYDGEWTEAANPVYLNTADGSILVYDVGLGLCWDEVDHECAPGCEHEAWAAVARVEDDR